MHHVVSWRIAVESIEQSRGKVYGDDESSAAVEILSQKLEWPRHGAVESAAKNPVDDDCVRRGFGEGERRFAGHLVLCVRSFARGQAIAHQLAFGAQSIASDVEEVNLRSISTGGQQTGGFEGVRTVFPPSCEHHQRGAVAAIPGHFVGDGACCTLHQLDRGHAIVVDGISLYLFYIVVRQYFHCVSFACFMGRRHLRPTSPIHYCKNTTIWAE